MEIQLDLTWRVQLGADCHVIEPLVFALLDGVEQGGHLNFAAAAAGVSYRHAWGLMRTWEQRLTRPLLALQRGRGATLTASGRALLAARDQALRTMRPVLTRAAASASETLRPSLRDPHPLLRIASSHSDLINGLVDGLRGRDWQVALDLMGSEGALRRYQRSDVDIAGFHLPLGELGRSVGMALIALLDDTRDQIFLLELRVLGLMSRPDRPAPALTQLTGGGLRFINRQPGSGTRLVFDGLLGLRSIAPGLIDGYRDEEYTHSAIAATVASGAADVGFGTASAATKFALQFTPLVQERFYLCVRRSAPREVSAAVAAFARAAVLAAARAPAAAEIQPNVGLLRRLHNPI